MGMISYDPIAITRRSTMQAICPVCDDPIRETRIEVTIGDKTIVVCCEECAETARREPETYTLEPRS
jgi:RNase P subunit RPR2